MLLAFVNLLINLPCRQYSAGQITCRQCTQGPTQRFVDCVYNSTMPHSVRNYQIPFKSTTWLAYGTASHQHSGFDCLSPFASEYQCLLGITGYSFRLGIIRERVTKTHEEIPVTLLLCFWVPGRVSLGPRVTQNCAILIILFV